MPERVNQYGQPIGEDVPGWTPRARPGPAPMVGRYCTLEKLDAAKHADGLFDAYMEAPDGRDWTYLFVENVDALNSEYAGKGVIITQSLKSRGHGMREFEIEDLNGYPLRFGQHL